MFCNSVSGWVDNDAHCALVSAEQSLENTNPGVPRSEKAYLSMWCESAPVLRLLRTDALKLLWIETNFLFYLVNIVEVKGH